MSELDLPAGMLGRRDVPDGLSGSPAWRWCVLRTLRDVRVASRKRKPIAPHHLVRLFARRWKGFARLFKRLDFGSAIEGLLHWGAIREENNQVTQDQFRDRFQQLTGNLPFPWQQALYDRFVADRSDNIPSSCNLPTGVGKTSVIAVWLIALESHPHRMPRRLVYVVNRQTVVDQTTTEVQKLRMALELLNPSALPLAISTLRGQFADNREWCADPSRPAVVCGTVDMIGSRLLFSGYGIGFSQKPLHAGFLAHDALLVHDEAHLEPAFGDLLMTIASEQQRCGDFARLRVMELSATSRGEKGSFELTEEDRENSTVKQRIGARKTLHLHPIADEKQVAEEILQLALQFKYSKLAVLVFVLKVEDVDKVAAQLNKEKLKVRQLTGTLRGFERDKLITDPAFRRFLPGAAVGDETVYLVCTSAGEVGINISADHLVCDLSTFDSMAQRFGRVNRFGHRDDTEIHIVHTTRFDGELHHEVRLSRTLVLMERLAGDASPSALDDLDKSDRIAAFALRPTILTCSDILFDTWAMTSIVGKLPGRPRVEPYLHGITEWEPPQTQVAWRDEVGLITGDLLKEHSPEALLEDFPLKPQELLHDRSDRVFKHLALLAARHPTESAWLVDQEGGVTVARLKDLASRIAKDRINSRLLLLPPFVGGLKNGLLDGSSTEPVSDVSDRELVDDTKRPRRARVWNNDPELGTRTENMRVVRRIKFESPEEEAVIRFWLWFESPRGGDTDGSKSAQRPVLWQDHTDDVTRNVRQIVERLCLSEDLRKALIVAAKFHDLGKRRELWQRGIGNPMPTQWLAKSGGSMKPRDISRYRHEFGSLLDAENEHEFKELSDDMCDLVLHLISAHHGYGRPHFSKDQAFDPAPEHSIRTRALAIEIPQRFARLQRRFGRWGLAYLESILRAADYAASANPSKTVEVPF